MNELALHILDIAQNSIRAKANLIHILILEKPESNHYSISITDNGTGMDAAECKKATEPFYTSRTTRKVGLGIPLLKLTAETCGGNLLLESKKGKGTKLQANFGLDHIDRPVLGDIAGTLMILASAPEQADIHYEHQTPVGEFHFNTREIKEELDDVPLTTPEIRRFLTEMIQENLKQIQISE